MYFITVSIYFRVSMNQLKECLWLSSSTALLGFAEFCVWINVQYFVLTYGTDSGPDMTFTCR